MHQPLTQAQARPSARTLSSTSTPAASALGIVHLTRWRRWGLIRLHCLLPLLPSSLSIYLSLSLLTLAPAIDAVQQAAGAPVSP